MRCDKIRRSDAVPVQADAVLAATGENCAIADFGGAKAAIHLPDVGERNAKAASPALHHGRGHRERTVVSNYNFECLIALAR